MPRRTELYAVSRSSSLGPAILVASAAWGAFAVLAVGLVGTRPGLLIAVAALAAQSITLIGARWAERRRWAKPVCRMASELAAITQASPHPSDLLAVPELADLLHAIRDLRKAWQSVPAQSLPSSFFLAAGSGEISLSAINEYGMLAGLPSDSFDGKLSGDFATSDMVSRLEPRSFRWLESSPAEQEFLGWELKQLREMSFLEIVHPDDYPRAKEQLQAAVTKGEMHGLIVRIKTAKAKPKAIEMNVSVRYGPDLAVTHLRCHITDVTAKLRAERELKLRTRELTQVNEQLRQINRELEELKDRYRDLYQNAPAMYFSLDEYGRVLDCNDTLLRTLGYRREEIVGRTFERFLTEERGARFSERYAEAMRKGSVETESQWVKANGDLIDVWVSGTVIPSRDGMPLQCRNVAQDVTARHRLEAELQEKNDRLARTNEELSRKNKEMDEFAYVVSHDLQEPLRTLIAFSDFLLRDCGEQLDAEGREYVRYLVDASRRMRALIHGLLNLSRAGRVTGDFAAVNLDGVVAVVRADLAELIRGKGAELRVSGPLPLVWGDRDRIGQLIANLVGNALKYNNSAEPWVQVGTLPSDANASVTIFVRDNGIGIDPHFHAKIFQLFRRLHTSEEYEGTGAGLAICNKIVQAHGGRIWVESEPGQGSTFYVSIRRAPSEETASQAHVIHAT